MSGHTPGEWVVTFRSDGSSYISMGDPMSGPHKQFDLGFHSDFPSDVADARLLEAAPKLLAALQGVMRVADRATDEFDAARAAIAKATGTQP